MKSSCVPSRNERRRLGTLFNRMHTTQRLRLAHQSEQFPCELVFLSGQHLVYGSDLGHGMLGMLPAVGLPIVDRHEQDTRENTLA